MLKAEHMLIIAVDMLGKSYLSKSFKAINCNNQLFIESLVKQFNLNAKQDRAFRIIANHSIQSSGEQLKMYLRGMAGTGKSQGIKTLIQFFDKREEGYHFILSEVYSQLRNVDYIFIDEVSMVDC
ncbi:hypothetical protein K474DRAFT_1684233 [Panus rudis PR-1116 ss-1]|nr:hypothetical protein K474DRAFT_1684233 [Panus rudis PR-1116 ss-1]